LLTAVRSSESRLRPVINGAGGGIRSIPTSAEWAPSATAVGDGNWRNLASTGLTLVILPVLYSIFGGRAGEG
jgi:hypothetical protein